MDEPSPARSAEDDGAEREDSLEAHRGAPETCKDGIRKDPYRGALTRALSLWVLMMAAMLIYRFVFSQEAAEPRKPSIAEELARLRSEGIKYMDVKWGDWQTRLEGESLSRALAALETASEPWWIGWTGDRWIDLGGVTVTTSSEQVWFFIETRKTIDMRPLIYAKWARAGDRRLGADSFFDVLRSMKQEGSDPGDMDANAAPSPGRSRRGK